MADRGHARRGQAHPRSRGENTRRPVFRSPAKGSSPLTRGKPEAGRPRREQGGLIPAHAGKTRPRRGDAWPTRAHPRSRGENDDIAPVTEPVMGSSPLTRGKRDDRTVLAAAHGLIPAHAGKTSQAVWISAGQGAHPRSRGENVTGGPYSQSSTGSSPLTRGKRMRPLRM